MKRLACVTLMLSIAPLGCSKREPSPSPAPVTAPATTLAAPVSVKGVALGKEIGADKRVTAESDAFGPKDTIYASVETAGTGRARLRALWSFVRGGKTAKVDETTIEIDAAGPVVNEFHVSKPSGWPKGDYKVEIFFNDEPAPVASKAFKVS